MNKAWDVDLRRGLVHLAALGELGFAANRRLLHVQKASPDTLLGDEVFARVTSPCPVGKQRASGLPYGDPVVLVLFQVTEHGLCVALFFTRSYARMVGPGLAQLAVVPLPPDTHLQRAFAHVECAMDELSRKLDSNAQHLVR